MPRRGSNPGVRSPGDPSPSQMPTRPSRANSCRGLQNSRTCGARWVLLSAARPSPRPCTTRCGPAPAPAALPRPRPTLLLGGRLQTPPARRAASPKPAIFSALSIMPSIVPAHLEEAAVTQLGPPAPHPHSRRATRRFAPWRVLARGTFSTCSLQPCRCQPALYRWLPLPRCASCTSFDASIVAWHLAACQSHKIMPAPDTA